MSGESMNWARALKSRVDAVGRSGSRSGTATTKTPKTNKPKTARRPGRSGTRRGRTKVPPVLPWYLIAIGVAVAASTSAAQKRAVELLSAPDEERTDPLPEVAPDWLKRSRRARSLWTLVSRVQVRVSQDNLMLIAAGIAFYGMFAIFPALGALVSIYGLFGDTHMVQTQVQQLTALLPH